MKTHIRASIYVNGSLQTSLETEMISSKMQCPALSLMLTGDAGIAIGRSDTTKAPPVMGKFEYEYMDTLRSKSGSDSFWAGDLDELKIWNSSKTRVELFSQMNTTCRANNVNAYAPKPLACFGFDELNGSLEMAFEDSGSIPQCKAVPIVGDKESSWCTTRGDDGLLLDQFSTATNPPRNHLGASWGICSDKPRLPGLGFEYSESALLGIADSDDSASPQSDALQFARCVNTAINFTSNSAFRYFS